MFPRFAFFTTIALLSPLFAQQAVRDDQAQRFEAIRGRVFRQSPPIQASEIEEVHLDLRAAILAALNEHGSDQAALSGALRTILGGENEESPRYVVARRTVGAENFTLVAYAVASGFGNMRSARTVLEVFGEQAGSYSLRAEAGDGLSIARPRIEVMPVSGTHHLFFFVHGAVFTTTQPRSQYSVYRFDGSRLERLWVSPVRKLSQFKLDGTRVYLRGYEGAWEPWLQVLDVTPSGVIATNPRTPNAAELAEKWPENLLR